MNALHRFTGILLLACCGMNISISTANAEQIIAYFPEWGIHTHDYRVKRIIPAAGDLTVINYAFVEPGPDGDGDIVCQFDDPEAAYQRIHDGATSVDGSTDAWDQPLRGHFNQFKQLKAHEQANPHLKVLIAIGGWLGSVWFSDAALTAESRRTFVASCIDLFIHGNLPEANNAGGDGAAAGVFDGFDIDWEYPLTGGAGGTHHNNNDDENLTELLKEFRRQMDPIREGLLLTMAVPGSDFRGDNYQINVDKASVDWFNLMSYDFHGSWENKTGMVSNILTSKNDPSSDAFKLSLDNTVRLYTETYGVGVEQLVAGGTMYGLGWRNVSSANNGLYQNGQPAAGEHEDGYNYWYFLSALEGPDYQWFWDDQSMAAWLYSASDGIFWTLDDPQSWALKRRYVDTYGLLGIMFWEISGDDENNTLFKALVSGVPAPLIEVQEIPGPGPSVSITQPQDCSISLEGFNQVVNASAGAGAEQVEFWLDGNSIGHDNRAPWSWAAFNLPAGVHELQATASDADGNYSMSANVSLDVRSRAELGLWQTGVSYSIGDEVFYDACIYAARRNHVGSRVRTPGSKRYWNLVTCSGDCSGGGGGGGNTPPSVQITSPENGDVFTSAEAISVEVSASDNTNVARVGFWVDGAWQEDVTTAPYVATIGPLTVGGHTIKAVAIDDDSAPLSAEHSVDVTVATPGTCSLHFYNPGATYLKGQEVQHNGTRWRCKRNGTSGIPPGTSPSRWTNLGTCNS